MVNSIVWVSTRFATCYGLKKPPFVARDAIEYGHAACLPSSIRYNERLRTTLSQKTSFIKPSTAQGVNRLYFPVLGQLLRSSCSPTTATLAWFMLRLTSSHRGARCQNPRAPSEIPASAGAHHEGAAAPVWEVHVFRDVDIQNTSIAGRDRHQGRFRDVRTVKELTVFD